MICSGSDTYRPTLPQVVVIDRTVHRTPAVARTIADLAGEERVGTAHLLEALGYRERIAVDVEPRWGPRFPDVR